MRSRRTSARPPIATWRASAYGNRWCSRKTRSNTLPLSKKIKNLTVVGKAADDIGIQCGGWTIDWQGKPGPVIRGGTTILSAIKQAVGSDTQMTYSGRWQSADGRRRRYEPSNKPDAIIAVIGEMPYAEGQGDRKDLSLSRAGYDID